MSGRAKSKNAVNRASDLVHQFFSRRFGFVLWFNWAKNMPLTMENDVGLLSCDTEVVQL